MEAWKEAAEEAMKLLDRKDRTVFELEQFLLQKNFPEAAVGQALEFLQKKQIISDKRFCRQYMIESFEKNKSWQQVKQDLLERGISPSVLESLPDQLDHGEGESDENRGKREISRIMEKEGLSGKSLRKVAGRLVRLGFSEEQIYEWLEPLTEKLREKEEK